MDSPTLHSLTNTAFKIGTHTDEKVTNSTFMWVEATTATKTNNSKMMSEQD